MACLEHRCTVCGWFACDNTPTSTCPMCGARCTTIFDEAFDHHHFDHRDDEEDGDEEIED